MSDRLEIPQDVSGAELPSRAPTDVTPPKTDRVMRAVAAASAVGVAAYNLLPPIFNLNPAGNQDELTAFYAAIATFLLRVLRMRKPFAGHKSRNDRKILFKFCRELVEGSLRAAPSPG